MIVVSRCARMLAPVWLRRQHASFGDVRKPSLLSVAVGGGGLIGGIAAWYAGRIRIGEIDRFLFLSTQRYLYMNRAI